MYVMEALEFNEFNRSSCQFLCFNFGRSFGAYVCTLYFITKFVKNINLSNSNVKFNKNKLMETYIDSST